MANYNDAMKFYTAAKKWTPKGKEAKMAGSLDQFTIQQGKNGPKIGGEEALEYVEKYGVIQGFIDQEMRRSLAERKFKGLGKVAQQFTHEGLPVKAGFAFGRHIESIQRLSHFFGKLKQGVTPYQAALDTKKYFFNYLELTNFEKGIRRFGAPFYSWYSFNLPLQLQALVQQPNKYAQLGRIAEYMQTDEAKNFDRKKLPKWINEQFGIPTRINNKSGDLEVAVLRSWIPAADLMSIVHTKPVHSMFRTGLGLAHPIPKTVAEEYMNHSFFTEREIAEFPGQSDLFLGIPMRKRTSHALKALPWGRAMNVTDRVFFPSGKLGELPAVQRAWSEAGFVPKTKAFDIETLKKRYELDVSLRKAKLRRFYNRAKREKNSTMMSYWKNLLEDVDVKVPKI
jgi:hypothetical protein